MRKIHLYVFCPLIVFTAIVIFIVPEEQSVKLSKKMLSAFFPKLSNEMFDEDFPRKIAFAAVISRIYENKTTIAKRDGHDYYVSEIEYESYKMFRYVNSVTVSPIDGNIDVKPSTFTAEELYRYSPAIKIEVEEILSKNNKNTAIH